MGARFVLGRPVVALLCMQVVARKMPLRPGPRLVPLVALLPPLPLVKKTPHAAEHVVKRFVRLCLLFLVRLFVIATG